jgi:uncharacterized protein (TIGR02145 family)
MHQAGYLNNINGQVQDRGSHGYYWSGTQNISTEGWLFDFSSGFCGNYYHLKTQGFPLRCLKSPSPPTVNSYAPGSPTNSSVTTGGAVTSTGDFTVTARGVCWSTTTGPTIALTTKTLDGTGSGSFTSNISGLNPNTLYYYRAYATNSIGTAYGNEEVFTTTGLTCGNNTVTTYHVAGSVAPVAKTVVYGTVNNIPGETAKCWITRNLGASQQATALNDATEASSGWFWQFNRKQGYMHDGTTRTPNTTWITNISESSNWQAANDPCISELGSAWRLPTSAEWNNVDNSGGWTTSTSSWNSELKIHSAGYLFNSSGDLMGRGSNGDYWSSAQVSASEGYDLTTISSLCSIYNHSKTYGFSVRCIKTGTITVSTTAITNITNSSVVSGGLITSDGGGAVTARGVCWSLTTAPTVALSTKTTNEAGLGSFTSQVSGLNPNSTYYLRAYATTIYGTTYGNEVSFKTSSFTCGTSAVTIYHTAGNISPVSKTVTYGTVKNIPGDTTKCWITRNLGAGQQATALNDTSESSAGWYWQFNRKQGFKHNGTTRTPNTTWISTISEDADWLGANDPCALELGNGWMGI